MQKSHQSDARLPRPWRQRESVNDGESGEAGSRAAQLPTETPPPPDAQPPRAKRVKRTPGTSGDPQRLQLLQPRDGPTTPPPPSPPQQSFRPRSVLLCRDTFTVARTPADRSFTVGLATTAAPTSLSWSPAGARQLVIGAIFTIGVHGLGRLSAFRPYSRPVQEAGEDAATAAAVAAASAAAAEALSASAAAAEADEPLDLSTRGTEVKCNCSVSPDICPFNN